MCLFISFIIVFLKPAAMKNLLVLLPILFSPPSFGQNIQVLEQSATIDKQNRNCLTVVIAGTDAANVSKAWKKELKDMKGKVSDRKFLFADDCEVKSMGENSFDVYAVVEASKGGIKLIVAFDLGGGYLNSREHPDRFLAARTLVYRFALEQTRSAVSTELKGAEKTLVQMEKELVSIQKDKERFEAEIEECKRKIIEAEENLKTNVTQQTAKKTEIEGQVAIVGQLGTKLESVK